ncbi:hypothetical protein ITP53_01640 [Nonomuraea sp. K274]|uniref:Aminoglycoside phosphotransferase domain-containing protein n=1 Tax=Nonomuraea cypriaca TaxID=1187855 RepID=A0A931A3L3_9ACTN|nr:phosphotransferase [Nonomuraea cypriaca]MBF8184468.1 hypothetical protein [Nonomuraea cypriaca]
MLIAAILGLRPRASRRTASQLRHPMRIMPSPELDLSHIEELLSRSLGTTVSIADSEHVTPWSIWRCRLTAPSDGDTIPQSVIVKMLRDDPKGFRTDPRQIATERAALEFLEESAFASAPRLIASDLRDNLLVMEDLPSKQSLAELTEEAGAERSVAGRRAFARAIGDLHALSAGREAIFYGRQTRYCAAAPEADRLPVLGHRWGETSQRLAELGLAPNGRVAAELATLHDVLAGDDPEHRKLVVLTNGDPEPNNFLVEGDHGWIIDFEFAGYRHALTNLAWVNVPGPMWLTVADPYAETLETDYRKAAADVSPGLADDRVFGQGMAAAGFASAFRALNRFPVLDERPQGHRSRPQLVSILESAAATADRHRSFAQLAAWTRLLADHLRRRWADADLDLATIPSYTRR